MGVVYYLHLISKLLTFCLRSVLFKVGKFTYVENTNNLRSDMATYYDFFSTNTIRNEPIISIPYIDAFGTGKIQLNIIHLGLLQVVQLSWLTLSNCVLLLVENCDCF